VVVVVVVAAAVVVVVVVVVVVMVVGECTVIGACGVGSDVRVAAAVGVVVTVMMMTAVTVMREQFCTALRGAGVVCGGVASAQDAVPFTPHTARA